MNGIIVARGGQVSGAMRDVMAEVRQAIESKNVDAIRASVARLVELDRVIRTKIRPGPRPRRAKARTTVTPRAQ